MEKRSPITNIRLLNWVVLGLMVAFSVCFMKRPFSIGVFLGGLLAIANFNALRITIGRAFAPNGAISASKGSLMIKYYLRLFVLGVIVYALISRQWVDPIGLAVGLSCVVLGITVYGVQMAWKMSSREAI